MNLPLVPLDKANHFIYGAIAASLGGLHSVAIGGLLCVLVAVAKEIYDKRSGKGDPEVLDVVATVLGGAVVLLPLAVWRFM